MDNPQKIFLFFSMKRAGHHCILYWIKSGFSHSARLNSSKAHKPTNVPKKHSSKTLFINFEDQFLSTPKVLKQFPHAKFYIILVIRDPFNLFASRFTHKWKFNKIPRANRNPLQPQIELWKDHAKAFVEKNEYIKINYNTWFSSEEYRNTISEICDTNPNGPMDYVPAVGRGSSFDGRRIKGTKMNVLHRWLQLEDDLFHGIYKQIFEDNELIELTRKIYGDIFVEEIFSSDRWLT